MGVLTFTFLIHTLTQRKSDIEFRKTRITKKIADLSAYSAAVANGQIQLGDLLALPGAQMGRAMQYLTWAHNSSVQYMQQQAPFMMQWYMNQLGPNQTPEQMQQNQEYVMRMLYEQGRDKAMEIESRNLKVEEDRLKQEQSKLEVLAQEVEQELKAAQDARKEAVKDVAPKYTANA